MAEKVSCSSCRALFPKTRNPAGRPDQSRILVRCPDCRERARRYVQDLCERRRRPVESALGQTIALGSLKVPAAMKAGKFELHSYKGSVPIKGIRMFAKRGWPVLVQVLVGKRWVTVIRGLDPSNGANLGITAKGIKARVRHSKC